MRSTTVTLQPEHLQFIARIYDCLLEPGAWRGVLDELCGFTGAKASNLLVSDQFLPEVQVTHASSQLPDELLARYAAEYARYEVEGVQNLLRHPTQTWVGVEELISTPVEDLPSSQWLKREYGIFHRSSARLNANKGWFDVVTLNMAERAPLGRAEAELSRLFLPHLAKAVEIGRPFQVLRARFNAVLAALDRFRIGVLILGPLGHVVLRNREASRILELKDGLALDRSGRATATDPAAASALAQAVQRSLATATGQGVTAEVLVAVPRRSGEDAFLVEVSPLRGRELGAEDKSVGAVAFVVDPTHHATVSTRGMKEIYALTEAEADVLGLLVSGHGSAEMAERRVVSVPTIRTQIKQVLAKTGTHSRPALVRLALTVNLPVDPADS